MCVQNDRATDNCGNTREQVCKITLILAREKYFDFDLIFRIVSYFYVGPSTVWSNCISRLFLNSVSKFYHLDVAMITIVYYIRTFIVTRLFNSLKKRRVLKLIPVCCELPIEDPAIGITIMAATMGKVCSFNLTYHTIKQLPFSKFP